LLFTCRKILFPERLREQFELIIALDKERLIA